MIAHKDKVQGVKQMVNTLNEQGRSETQNHCEVYRPWGSYDSVDMGGRFQVKHISVKPGACLSLQMHHHRAEHWIVVSGTAEVTCDDNVFLLCENQSTYIPIAGAPPAQPGQDPVGDHRSAIGQLPGRRRYRALRRYLRSLDAG